MKKLFSRAKKPVQNWETWDENSEDEYDWDRVEDADEGPVEEEPDAEYAEEAGRYRRGKAGQSRGDVRGVMRRGGREDESAPSGGGDAGFGWREDEIDIEEEADAGYYEQEEADAGYDRREKADAGYYGREEANAGYYGQEEADAGEYAQEETDAGYDRRERAARGRYGQKKAKNGHHRKKKADVGNYRQEEAKAGYYGQEESGAGDYEQEKPEAVYYGQKEPATGAHRQYGWEDSAAGYYGQEETDAEYEQRDSAAVPYGRENPAATQHRQEEADTVYYGQEEQNTGYYGQEELKAGYYGQREQNAAYHGQEDQNTGYYEEEDQDSAYYGQGNQNTGYYGEEDQNAGYYGEEVQTTAYYGQENQDTGYYGQENQNAAYYGQENQNAGYYGQEDQNAAYYGQEDQNTGYYGEEGQNTVYYRQEEPEAAHYGHEESDAIGYGQQEDFAGYAEPADRSAEVYPEEEEFYREEDAYAEPPVRKRERRRAEQEYEDRSEEGFLARFARAVRGMELMDKVMLATGAVVLILAVVMVAVFASARIVKNQVADFANVGLQLEGISTIGEKGLMAVANAELTRLAEISPTAAPPEPQETEEPRKDYNEIGYDRQVSVEPGFTSIQKDLKIKFINTKTDKLVPNVPFSVTVTGPDGKTLIWSDDDMDGIIYKQDITPGTYQVAMETLTDSRYAGYTISTAAKSVEVKKEISYNKVDVANEVKKESEVNVAKEDTRKNETVVESSLQDTVAWVESKTVASTYSEVPKSTIPDPATLTAARIFRRMEGVELLSQEQTDLQTGTSSQIPGETQTEPPEGSEAEPTQVPEAEPTQVPEAEPTQVPTAEPTQVPTAEPTQVPTAEPTQIPTAVPTQMPTAEPTLIPTAVPTQMPTPVPTQIPSPTPAPMRGSLAVDHTNLSGGTGAVLTAKATAAGFDPGRNVSYFAVTNNPAVATASVDVNGNVSIYTVAVGTAVITVTANYEGGDAQTEAAAQISVTVGGGVTLSLDASALTVSVQVPVTIHASIGNSIVQDQVVSAESSNANVAVVSVDKKAVTITGVAEGVAFITVKYKENGAEVSASCTVSVKRGPREDKTTLLKDAEGRQLYVVDNNTYREAVYADYYTAEKFFIRGEAKYTGWQTIDGRLYYFTAEGNKVTGEQVIQGAKYNFASDGSLVTGDGTLGIDVSKWNGTIDWNAVKNSGVSYVIIRCGYRGSSEGKLIEDPKFEANIKGAAAAGLKVGVYFFTQAVNEIEAVEEASMVLGQIRNYKISYPVFLDVEASGGRGDGLDKSTRTAVCRAFCQTIQNAGYTAGIYANKQWLEGRLDAGSLGNFKIWLAQYAAAPTYTGRYDMWQYKATGSISGISGNVDLNISYLGY